MIPEDRRQAEARTRIAERGEGRLEQMMVLLLGTVALLGFLLV